jgi:hypothetical protein
MVAYQKKAHFQNFHGNVSLTPRRTYAPESLTDLVDIVREAEADMRRVRAIGSGWSFTKVNLTEDYLVSTDNLNRTLSETMSGK